MATDMLKPARNLPLSPWAHTTEEIYEMLASSEAGLSEAQALERQAEFGLNEFKKKDQNTIFRVLLRQFASPLIFMLVGAAGVTIVLREPTETIVILLAIVVNALLGFYQEYKAEQTLKKLFAYIKDITRVIRAEGEHEIDSSMLVPGDIIRLSLGMRVPADARLISVNDLSTDESVLTGESLSILKSTEIIKDTAGIGERTNMVFAGTLIVEGYATAIVVATGSHTEFGRIALLVSESESEQTPLQRSLKKLAWLIFWGVNIIVIGLFFLGIQQGQPVLEMLLLSVAVAVGAIPEALPIALTVILTAGVSHIAKRRGIVRNLAAAETLGSTTVVMTDKTGTLTQAKMQLTGILSAEALLEGEPATKNGEFTQEEKDILTAALVCIDVAIENPSESYDKWRLIGRALETNITRSAAESGIDVVSVITKRRVPVLPFNSTNKFSVAHDKESGSYIVFGAPDILLARSRLVKEEHERLEARIHAISEEGKRLIGVARIPHKELPRHASGHLNVDAINELHFLGAIVLYDPIRPETADAIQKIGAYGAKVVMVTGDLKGTALAISRELGWNVPPEGIITGTELKELSDDDLKKRLPDIQIFSRVTPEDKLRIGKLYQARGEVVAMTGDGVNDAPSLKIANIGVALGSGSDVAKSVADLVILDDNFETIVLAIEEGRRIIANIRKAFAYLMANCLDEVILVGGSLVFGLALPLNALQIIWVNFFTGSLPALSFSFEAGKEGAHMHGKAETKIFNTEVKALTIGIGILTSVLLFVLYFILLRSGIAVPLARTVLFACFATYTLVIAYSFKNLHYRLGTYPLFDNRALNLSVVFALLLVLCSMSVPFFRNLLGLSPMPLAWLPLIGAWLIFNIALVEIAKWWFTKTRSA